MDFLQPATWTEALAMKAAHPDALPIAGGTDVMVEINFDRQRPPAFLDLTRIAELSGWGLDDGMLRVGAGVTYARLIGELGDRLPGLAMASRTVGSPPGVLEWRHSQRDGYRGLLVRARARARAAARRHGHRIRRADPGHGA